MTAPSSSYPPGNPDRDLTLVRAWTDNTQSLALLLAADGTILDLNPPMADCLGWGAAQWKGRLFWAQASEEERGAWQAPFRKVLAEGKAVRLDLELRGRWYDTVFTPSLDRSGKAAGVALVGWDITERKRTDAALRDSEERYRRLFEVESDAIVLVDTESGSFVDVNPAAQRLYGYSREEFLRLRHYEVSAEPAVTREAIARQIATVALRWHRKKDGSVFPVEISGDYFEAQGRKLHVAAIRDISERMRVEIELRQSEERHRLLFENAQDPIFVHDEQARTLAVNPQAVKQLGYTHAELMELTIHQIDSAEDRAHTADRMARLIKLGQLTFETAIQRKDGSLLRAEVNACRIVWDGKPAFLSICRDIEEHKKAETALLEMNRFAQATIDALSAHLCVMDETGNILSTNRSWEAFAVANPPQAQNVSVGSNYLEICRAVVGPDTADATAFLNGLRTVLRGEADHFEFEYACHSPTEQRWFVAHVTRFAGAGPLRFVVAHENITKRKQAEEALRQSRDLVNYIAEGTADAVFVKDLQGRYQFFNSAASRFVGKPAAEVLGQDDTGLFPPEEARRLMEEDRHTLATGVTRTFEEFVTTSVGPTTFLATKGPLRDAQGQLIGVFGVARNITALKQVERRLRASEANLHRAQAIAHVGDWSYDFQSGLLSWSPEMYRIFGVTPETFEHTVNGLVKLTHPDDLPRQARAKEAFLRGEAFAPYEYRVIQPGGGVRVVEVLSSEVQRDESGQPRHMFGTVQDITERKQAEAALQHAARTNQLLHASIVAITACPDIDAALCSLVQNAVELGGMDCGAAYRIEGQEAVLCYSTGLAPEFMEQVARLPLSTPYVVEVLGGLGKIHYVSERHLERARVGERYGVRHVVSFGLAAAGRPIAFLNVVSRRVERPSAANMELIRVLATETESLLARLKAEEELRAAKAGAEALAEELAAIMDTAPAAMFVANDVECRRMSGNRYCQRLFGLPPNANYSNSAPTEEQQAHFRVMKDGSEIPPERLPVQMAAQGQEVRDYEFSLVFDDGRVRTLVGDAVPLLDADGRRRGAVGVFVDITERKETEFKLAERVKELQAFYSLGEITQRDGISLDDVYQEFVNFLPASWQHPEATCTRIVMGNREFRTSNFKPCAWMLSAPIAIQGEVAGRIEVGCLEEMPALDNGPFLMEERRLIDTLAIQIGHLTERKRAEVALGEARWRLESILAGTHVGTWQWNIQTGETVFNEVWAELVGYTLAELAPMSIETWKAFTHPEDLKQSSALLERHFAGELPFYECECRMRHKDGSWVWIHDRGRVITRTPDGKPLMMFGTHADITARKQSEDAIRRALAEKTVLLKEVHHRVKNNLQVVTSLLNLQGKEDQNQEVRKILASTHNRVRSIALIHENLHRSQNLAHLNLDEYLKGLCAHLLRSTGPVGARVRIEARAEDAGISIGLDQAVPCGLLINELVTNALKHAFPGERRGCIRVTFEKAAAQDIRLTVADDGVGLPATVEPQRTESLGLQLVCLLTDQLHGTVTFERGEGTAVRILFPNAVETESSDE